MGKKYNSFNIEPGMTTWVDMPEDYKRQYAFWLAGKQAADRIAKGELMDYSSFREFDPLKPQNNRKVTCVLHIAVFLEPEKRESDSGGMIEDFVTAKKCIQKIVANPGSGNKKFKLDLVISINGFITTPTFIKYFRSLDKKWLTPSVYCQVFQRSNTGFHWGGFHDVWMRYKDVECHWFATMESDHKFKPKNWFDKVVPIMNERKEIGSFGKHQNLKYVEPYKAFGYKIPNHMWRDNNGTPRKMRRCDTIHSCGAFHFCRREVLKKIDDLFGCFTFSMGCNHKVDGIVLGEVGFCDKIKVLGYQVESKRIEFLVVPMRGFGAVNLCPTELAEIIAEKNIMYKELKDRDEI